MKNRIVKGGLWILILILLLTTSCSNKFTSNLTPLQTERVKFERKHPLGSDKNHHLRNIGFFVLVGASIMVCDEIENRKVK